MKRASHKDKQLIVQLLCKSFAENKSVNFIVRQDHFRLKRIAGLMAYSFEVCYRFGSVWLSDDHCGCALILYPHLKRNNILLKLYLLQLIFQVITLEGLKKALTREKDIQGIQPRLKMAYLWFLGVDPDEQHRGVGTTLLNEIIADTKRSKLPVYLETSTVENIKWYKRFGFVIYDRLESGYTLYFLKRD